MSDIFISYASADRDRAKVMADVLAERGWSVWWDRAIPAGRQFDEVIEEALDAARCVVVLWSETSVASTWVKTEAAEAMRRKALIPALIAPVKIPLEFRRLQAADLSHWHGDRADPNLIQFFESIDSALERGGTAESDAAALPAAAAQSPAPARSAAHVPPPAPAAPRKLSAAAIGAIAAAVIVLGGGAVYIQRDAARAEAEKVAAAEKAAAEKAAAEKSTAETAAAERASAAARARPETGDARGAAARPKRTVPTSGSTTLQWRDHALGFTGTLSWTPSSVMLRSNVADLRTGIQIGSYTVPAFISQQGPAEYIVSAEFGVPGDSATPGPHTHTSRLRLRAESDGTLSFLQNCPRPGECY